MNVFSVTFEKLKSVTAIKPFQNKKRITSLLKMKQQTHDKFNVWKTRKKSEPQMELPIWGSDFFRILQTFNLS